MMVGPYFPPYWFRGHDAYLAGLDFDECPTDIDGKEQNDWMAGWLAAYEVADSASHA